MKKKYLIKGAFALVFGAFVASCSDYDNDYTSIADAKQATFAENFVKFYGNIDPNQDWGFGETTNSSRVRMTRANSSWDGWATPPSENSFKSSMSFTALPTSMYDGSKMQDYYLSETEREQEINFHNGNFSVYVMGTKRLKFNNPSDAADNMYFYVLPNANLTFTEAFTLQKPTNFKMYIASGATVTFEKGTNSNIQMYNRGTVVVKGSNQSGVYGRGIIYNQGTMTFEGTSTDYVQSIKPYGANVSGALVIHNAESQIVNEGTINTKGLRVEGSGHFKNVNGGVMNVSGYTIVNSNDCSWINDGLYNTEYFHYTAGSTDVINNCRLNVSELFYMNLGDTEVNRFLMDGGSSVVTKDYWADGPGFIRMGSNSVFKVKETATLNHTKPNYGIYGDGNDYAVFHAKNVVAGAANQGFEVTYGGRLAIVADAHFNQGNDGQADHPYIDFKDGCSISNIYAPGFSSGTPAISIRKTTCNPGFPSDFDDDDGDLTIENSGTGSTTSVEVWKVKYVINHKRVFCEDLGSTSNRKDFDYNDVVFDAKIIEEYSEDRTYDGTTLTSTSAPYEYNYYADITVYAAGGELSLTVGGEEVNSLFGKTTNYIINTVKDDDDTPAAHIEGLKPQTFKYEFESEEDAKIGNIPVMVKTQNVPIYLKSEKGEAPQKICVPVNTRWTYERVAIDEAYSNFADWVGHKDGFKIEDIWGTYNEDNVYPWDNVVDETGTTSAEFAWYKETGTEYTFDTTGTIVWDESAAGGRNLSESTPITISSENFTDVSKGTVVRLYGIDNGNASVTVIAGDVELGNTTRATGKCYIYTLSKSQAASVLANGLSITGSDFRLYYVTVGESSTPEEPEDTEETIVEVEPSFSSSEISGTAVSGLSQTTLTSTGVNIPSSYFTNAGAGTEVYVYGTGNESSVNVSVNGSNLSKANSRQTRGTTYVTKAKKTVMFTMTAEQAAAAQTSGIKITGSGFVLHAVGVVIVEGGSGESKDGQIWPNTGSGSAQSAFTIDGSKFTDSMVGKTLRIYSSEFGQYHWAITIEPVKNKKGDDFAGLSIANWANNNSHIAASIGSATKNESKQCIELVLSSGLITIFKNQSIQISPTNLKITNVTVE